MSIHVPFCLCSFCHPVSVTCNNRPWLTCLHDASRWIQRAQKQHSLHDINMQTFRVQLFSCLTTNTAAHLCHPPFLFRQLHLWRPSESICQSLFHSPEGVCVHCHALTTALYSVIQAVCGGRRPLCGSRTLTDISTVGEVNGKTVKDIMLTVLLNINQHPDMNVTNPKTANITNQRTGCSGTAWVKKIFARKRIKFNMSYFTAHTTVHSTFPKRVGNYR